MISQVRRWSQSARALRSSGWLLLAAVVSRGISIGAFIVVSRMLVPDDLGRLALLQSAATVLSGAAGLGLGLAVTRQVADVRARDPVAAGRYLGAALILTVIAALITAAALVVFHGSLASDVLGDARLAELVPPAGVAVAGMAVAATAQAGIVGLECFRDVALLQAVQAGLSSIGLVVGAAAGDVHGALVGFAAGHVVAGAVALGMVGWSARSGSIRLRAALRRHEARALASFAAPAFIAAVVVSAALVGGQLLLRAQEGGYTHIAEFAVAYRWHLLILFVPAALTPAVVPVLTRLRREDGTEARRTLDVALIVGVGMVAVPAVVLAVGAPVILQFNGAFYADHPWPLVVLAFAAVPSMLNNVLSSAAISFGAIRLWLLSDAVFAVGFLLLAVALVPSMLASGLAVAYLGAFALTDLALVPTIFRSRIAVTKGDG